MGPKNVLVLLLGGLLVLQLRTSIYLYELESREFVRGISLRFRRNLAILGGADVAALEAEAAASGAANDDLDRERAITVGALGWAPGPEGVGRAGGSSEEGQGDDGAEVNLLEESTASLPSSAAAAKTASGPTAAGAPSSSLLSASSIAALPAAAASPNPGPGADTAGGARTLDVLAASDVAALREALGGGALRVASKLATLPPWLADSVGGPYPLAPALWGWWGCH